MLSVSRTLQFVQIAGCEMHEHKGCKTRLSTFKVHGWLLCPIFL